MVHCDDAVACLDERGNRLASRIWLCFQLEKRTRVEGAFPTFKCSTGEGAL